MPQGKMKVKAKLPAGVKNKKRAAKGPAVTKRSSKCLLFKFTLQHYV
jgi:hypothetical protein